MNLGEVGKTAVSKSKTLLLSAKDKLFGDSKFEKAKFNILDQSGKTKTTITVQFNPSEYSLSRSTVPPKKYGKQGSSTNEQFVRSNPTTLSLSLYFDTISGVGLPDPTKDLSFTAKMKKKIRTTLHIDSAAEPEFAAAAIIEAIKCDKEQHAIPIVQFVWGSFDFSGVISSVQSSYTMFTPLGTPVKSKLDLTIVGEETGYTLSKKRSPFESPDRTKERSLVQGDQLWMISQEEYNDPNQWKTIAKANGILNPRKTEFAQSVKVPSIK